MSRALPHSVEAEMGVLGSMLLSPAAIGLCSENATEAHFYIPAHQIIFTVLVEVWHSGGRTDLITFTQVLRDKKLLDTVGGASFVSSLFTFVPTAANVGYYLEIVRDKYVLREIIATCTEKAQRAYEAQDEVNTLIEECASAFMGLSATGKKRRTTSELTADVLDSMSDYERVFGISTGFPQLDEVIGGLAPAAKIVLAGQISGGKSAFAQCMAVSLAVKRNIPVAIFTFEMSDEQTLRRILQIHSGIAIRSIVNRTADSFENAKFIKASGEVSSAPLHIISERLDIAGIRSRCLQLRPRVCIVDYLQIVPEKKQKGENRTDQLDRMSAETKQMAGGLGFPMTVVELSQLTEKSNGEMMTRGSKGILADSDNLMTLESDDDAKPGDTVVKTLHVPKNRDGERDAKIEFTFRKPTTTFREKKAPKIN